jgi:hypothetical protein
MNENIPQSFVNPIEATANWIPWPRKPVGKAPAKGQAKTASRQTSRSRGGGRVKKH